MVYVYDRDLLQQTDPDSTAVLKEFTYFLRGGGCEAFEVRSSAQVVVSPIHSFCFERNLIPYPHNVGVACEAPKPGRCRVLGHGIHGPRKTVCH